MIDWLVDILAVLGGIVLVVGVFLQFGLGFSLISGGLFMVWFAVRIQKAHMVGLNGPANSE